MIIRFSFETPRGRYSDALVLPDDHTYTDVEIEAMKQQRLDDWLVSLTVVPPEEV